MLAYATAASAGSRGNVGKLRPAGRGESDQSASTRELDSQVPVLISRPVGQRRSGSGLQNHSGGCITIRDSEQLNLGPPSGKAWEAHPRTGLHFPK